MNTRGLDRALGALGPYLDDLVLCGAWAWFLYRRCLGRRTWIPAEFTRDLDCVGREKLRVRGSTVVDRLLARDFRWVPRGEETPPVASFVWPLEGRADIELEFLVPARGDGSRRILEIQSGLTAQALGDLEIVRANPLRLEIDDLSPLAGELSFRGAVQVPRVGHFVVQKALIHDRRTPSEQIKDFFHVFDLIDRENGMSDEALADVVAAKSKWSGEVATFVGVLERRLREPRFLVGVSEQLPPERRPSPTYIEREMRAWLERLTAIPGSQHLR